MQTKKFQIPPMKPLPVELKVKGDRIVLGDLHTVLAKPDLVEKVVSLAKKMRIKQASFIGDIFCFDMFSKYDSIWPMPSASVELETAGSIFRYWLSYFDSMEICEGNHDRRFNKHLGGDMGIDSLVALMELGELRKKVKTTRRDRVILKSGSTDFMLVHQDFYAKGKLVVAERLAQRWQSSIVTHHQHHAAAGVSKDGRFLLIDNPCLCDWNLTPYVQLNTNDMPRWNAGMTIIKDGHAHIYWDDMPIGML